MKKVKKKRKRKPVLKGWHITTEGYLIHNMSGRLFCGIHNLEKIGKFFIKAAEWLEEKE